MEAVEIYLRRTTGRVQLYKFCVSEIGIVTSRLLVVNFSLARCAFIPKTVRARNVFVNLSLDEDFLCVVRFLSGQSSL